MTNRRFAFLLLGSAALAWPGGRAAAHNANTLLVLIDDRSIYCGARVRF